MELYLLIFVIVVAVLTAVGYFTFKVLQLGKITKVQYNVIRIILLCVGLIYLILVETGVSLYG
jgi:cytochrome c oxidase assembly factor CtaG